MRDTSSLERDAPASEAQEPARRALRADLEATVGRLAEDIGPRNVSLDPEALERARDFCLAELRTRTRSVTVESYAAGDGRLENVVAEIPGSANPEQIVVLGAHYDSAEGSPGANDNASGVAVLLAVARMLEGRELRRTLRLAAFTAEEDPHFHSDLMGSLVYARGCRRRGDRVVAMLALDEVGYFSTEPGSQGYPFPLSLVYPPVGDFLAVVGNLRSRKLARQVAGAVRESSGLAVRHAGLPGFLAGVGASDHWSFWRCGYPAVMLTDTANFRYREFHTPEDLPGRIDYDSLAAVAVGVGAALAALTGASE